MTIANISRMSVDTLATRLAEAKRVAKQAESDIKDLSAQLIAKGVETVETDIARVTVTSAYDRVDLDTAAVKRDFTDWQDRYGKVTHVSSSVRVTFK